MNSLWHNKATGSDDNLIPLINIVFLLLIFFMVAGQMQAQQVPQLELPVNSDGLANQSLDHRIELDARQQLFFDGQPLTVAGLPQQLQNLPEDSRVTVLLHRHLRAEQIQPLLDQLRQQRITRVTLISQSEG